MPSSLEGYGIAATEAIHAGIPVNAARGNEHSRFCQNGKAMLPLATIDRSAIRRRPPSNPQRMPDTHPRREPFMTLRFCFVSLSVLLSACAADVDYDSSEEDLRRKSKPQVDAGSGQGDFWKEQDAQPAFLTCMGRTSAGKKFTLGEPLTFNANPSHSFALNSPTSEGGKLDIALTMKRLPAAFVAPSAVLQRADVGIRLTSGAGTATFSMLVGVAGYNEARFETSQGLAQRWETLDTNQTTDMYIICFFDTQGRTRQPLQISDL
jgi:hypothetical protein